MLRKFIIVAPANCLILLVVCTDIPNDSRQAFLTLLISADDFDLFDLFDLPQNTNNDKTRQLHKSK